MIPRNKKQYKLFYIQPNSKRPAPLVCFTTGDITQEWGDDWDDAPWEHNAGTPYYNNADAQYFEMRIEDGDLTSIKTPEEHFGGNSPFSVKKINSGMFPWLTVDVWDPESRKYEEHKDLFPAGLTLDKFIKRCQSVGIRLWVPHEPKQPKRAEE